MLGLIGVWSVGDRIIVGVESHKVHGLVMDFPKGVLSLVAEVKNIIPSMGSKV